MSKQGHFSVHKLEKSKFLAKIHMEYFHMGIPNQKIWVPMFFIDFSTPLQVYLM